MISFGAAAAVLISLESGEKPPVYEVWWVEMLLGLVGMSSTSGRRSQNWVWECFESLWWVWTPFKMWQFRYVSVQLSQLYPIRREKNLQDLPWRAGRGVLQLSCVREDIAMIKTTVPPLRICLLLDSKPGLEPLVVMVHPLCLIQIIDLSLDIQKSTFSPCACHWQRCWAALVPVSTSEGHHSPQLCTWTFEPLTTTHFESDLQGSDSFTQ